MTAFDKWWNEQSKKGDPLRNLNLVRDAFEAGRKTGYRDLERENAKLRKQIELLETQLLESTERDD